MLLYLVSPREYTSFYLFFLYYQKRLSLVSVRDKTRDSTAGASVSCEKQTYSRKITLAG
jgi:hypothetical protein